MTSNKPSLTVFCGSRHGQDQVHIDDAAAFGHWLGEQSWHLVYGGGNVGLMGEIARAPCNQAPRLPASSQSH